MIVRSALACLHIPRFAQALVCMQVHAVPSPSCMHAYSVHAPSSRRWTYANPPDKTKSEHGYPEGRLHYLHACGRPTGRLQSWVYKAGRSAHRLHAGCMQGGGGCRCSMLACVLEEGAALPYVAPYTQPITLQAKGPPFSPTCSPFPTQMDWPPLLLYSNSPLSLSERERFLPLASQRIKKFTPPTFQPIQLLHAALVVVEWMGGQVWGGTRRGGLFERGGIRPLRINSWPACRAGPGFFFFFII
uniref:Secreted protein n=1 Tax=Morchella importuna TaxID=1174673 RepID=A0A650AF90_9PEZI|nr:hypothetical protein [Morchella importuna]QGN66692.1 hypothetical protein [Morchella importuna]